MAKLVNDAIVGASFRIGEQIRRGRPLPVILGVLIGGGVGTLVGMRLWPYTIGIALLSALLGGIIASMLFRTSATDDAESE